jgi:hypothetical protein
MRIVRIGVVGLVGVASLTLLGAQAQKPLVFADYRTDKPGTSYKITVADLPKPYATGSKTTPGSFPTPKAPCHRRLQGMS